LPDTDSRQEPAALRTGEFPVQAPAAERVIDRFVLPGPLTILRAIVAVRVLLAAALLWLTFFREGVPRIEPTFTVGLLVIAAGASIHLLYQTRNARIPEPGTILLHATVDLLLATGVVAFGAGVSTPLAAIYVLLVAAYALVLPTGRGLIVVLVALTGYVAVTLRSVAEPGVDFWTQVLVIAFVGGLIAVLGNRLARVSREQHALAAALAQARLEADEILATIQSGVITVDGEGRLAFVNPRARRILGAEGFVAGEPVMDALRARSRDLHDAIDRGIRHGARLQRGEASVRRSDGSLFPVGVSTTTFYRPGGGPPSVTAIFTDISDLKRLQEFRLRTERLEAVAALSAALAHEIRNPLAAIRSAVEQLAADVEDDTDERVLADLVMRESERLNRLLSEFLDFSRVRAARFEPLDLLDVMHEAVRFVREHPATRGVTVRVEGDPVELEADRDLLHRIATNLMLNAAQALDGRGEIVATVSDARPSDGSGGTQERRARLVIRDTGPGIPESVRERLFEPFVSARPGGTGLGLAIVQRAVSAHRGIILVDTAPGAGTTFSIFLPTVGVRE
jgi:two-component system sensor histidine kinase PilS (NtrC family)